MVISRTPKPHQRPCFIPSGSETRPAGAGDMPTIEFNVTHQASFVALAGCVVPFQAGKDQEDQDQDQDPNRRSETVATAVFSVPKPSSAPVPSIPQVGIDVTCVDEPGRRRTNAQKTLKDVTDFIDIFQDVFSQRELDTMKKAARMPTSSSSSSLGSAAGPTASLSDVIKSSLRLFYAYWALKEAYIKMTGEALLAPWLRDLEFKNVVAPAPVDVANRGDKWGDPYTGVETWLYGRKVEDVRIELVAFESDYLVATAARGANLGSSGLINVGNGEREEDPWRNLVNIDIEWDVKPCATGTCQCLI